jgi:hypothetical protein
MAPKAQVPAEGKTLITEIFAWPWPSPWYPLQKESGHSPQAKQTELSGETSESSSWRRGKETEKSGVAVAHWLHHILETGGDLSGLFFRT